MAETRSSGRVSDQTGFLNLKTTKDYISGRFR